MSPAVMLFIVIAPRRYGQLTALDLGRQALIVFFGTIAL